MLRSKETKPTDCLSLQKCLTESNVQELNLISPSKKLILGSEYLLEQQQHIVPMLKGSDSGKETQSYIVLFRLFSGLDTPRFC